MHLVCYLRQGSKAFETYWTTAGGVEVMESSYLLSVHGRQEKWEDSPPGWPQRCTYSGTNSGPPTWEPEWPGGHPIAQWPRLAAGHSDDLSAGTCLPQYHPWPVATGEGPLRSSRTGRKPRAFSLGSPAFKPCGSMPLPFLQQHAVPAAARTHERRRRD